MLKRFLANSVRLLALCIPLASVPASSAESPVLHVGVTPIFPPLIFKEKDQLVGMEVDFARALGVHLGRTVEFVELPWEDQLPKLDEKRIDIVMSSLSITRARQFRVGFSDPYFRIGQMALVRREDLPQYTLGFPYNPRGTIGVLKNTTGDFLVQQEFSRSKRKTFTTSSAATRALSRKNIDLFISDSPLIWYLQAQNETGGLEAVPVLLTDEALAWAVRKSDTALLDQVNAFLKETLANGGHQRIVKKWLPTAK